MPSVYTDATQTDEETKRRHGFQHVSRRKTNSAVNLRIYLDQRTYVGPRDSTAKTCKGTPSLVSRSARAERMQNTVGTCVASRPSLPRC